MRKKAVLAIAVAGALAAALAFTGCSGSASSSSSAAGSASVGSAQASSASAAGATSASASSASNAARSATASGSEITEARAREIALEHAGVAEGDATFTKIGQDFEHGRHEWGIEFKANGKEYDYDIDMATGEIVSFDNEIDDDAPAGKGDGYIGFDAAKKAALDHAGLAVSDARDLKAELDGDSMPVHYDVEFKYGGKEYDYDIDAVTGDILKSEVEIDD